MITFLNWLLVFICWVKVLLIWSKLVGNVSDSFFIWDFLFNLILLLGIKWSHRIWVITIEINYGLICELLKRIQIILYLPRDICLSSWIFFSDLHPIIFVLVQVVNHSSSVISRWNGWFSTIVFVFLVCPVLWNWLLWESDSIKSTIHWMLRCVSFLSRWIGTIY